VTKVVFLLVPGLHLLDLAGPAQAFGTAADLGCGYELAYVAGQEDVLTAQGVTIKATGDGPRWPATISSSSLAGGPPPSSRAPAR
jgi:transcriptional regulator GlxA family with amidase domain